MDHWPLVNKALSSGILKAGPSWNAYRRLKKGETTFPSISQDTPFSEELLPLGKDYVTGLQNHCDFIKPGKRGDSGKRNGLEVERPGFGSQFHHWIGGENKNKSINQALASPFVDDAAGLAQGW